MRKKKNPSGSVSIQIVQKIGRINKVLKSVGSSNDLVEIERLYIQALQDLPNFYGPSLFDIPVQPSIHQICNDNIRVVGPDLIFGEIYKRIGFEIFKEPLLKHLVISRITHPGSKLRLANYLSDTRQKSISVYSIYRFLDKLNNKLKVQIEDISFAYTKSILGGQISVVFYDITTIYFEASEPDDFRIAGFSKEGKHQNPQILLGLLVGKDGYPIGYEIFEGNTFEGHTLIPVIERYISRFNLQKPIIIADSGLLSKSNIEILIKKGFYFILGARIKNEKQVNIKKILDLKLADGELSKITTEEGLNLHIGYSESRARKDKFNRDRGLKKLQKSLVSGRLTKSNINNRGYNKFLKLDGKVTLSLDIEKIDQDQKWDGLKGYITNTNLTSKEVVENYNNLWKIEKAFRISKTDLKIRPIYHRLKQRIEAHICISFMAYIIYKDFERIIYENGCRFSINEAIEQINKMYEINIENQNIRLKTNQIQTELVNILNREY